MNNILNPIIFEKSIRQKCTIIEKKFQEENICNNEDLYSIFFILSFASRLSFIPFYVYQIYKNNFITIIRAKMQSSRARSSSRASSSHKKPFFLTKYKERSGNRSVLNDSNGFGETDRKHSKSSRFNKTQDFSKMFLQRTFKNRFPLDESFAKTSRDIEGQNFNHHDPNLCVC